MYTPSGLVSLTLDVAGYVDNEDILDKHIIDNSCGDGAFLSEIVCRYCRIYIKSNGGQIEGLKSRLGAFIHGLDVDGNALSRCMERLDAVAASFGVHGVQWDLTAGSIFDSEKFYGEMDFVVGNPPYVRIHNLGDSLGLVRTLRFSGSGMTDLYLAFMELGIRMLRPSGRLCLITPSAWLQNKSGADLRAYLREQRCLRRIVDFCHEAVFDASTYTMISLIDNSGTSNGVYYSKAKIQAHPSGEMLFDPGFYDYYSYDEFCVGGSFVFNGLVMDPLFRSMFESRDLNSIPSIATVKMGFQTSADNIFIGQHSFSDGCIPVVKASRGLLSRCVFPYHSSGIIQSEEEFSSTAPMAMAHLRSHADALSRRSMQPGVPWYAFGRSQALCDVFKNKVSINSMIRDEKDLKIVDAPAGTGVYNGFYIISDLHFSEISRTLRSNRFVQYVHSLIGYKSGGYYQFGSSDLSLFLNVVLSSGLSKNDLQ